MLFLYDISCLQYKSSSENFHSLLENKLQQKNNNFLKECNHVWEWHYIPDIYTLQKIVSLIYQTHYTYSNTFHYIFSLIHRYCHSLLSLWHKVQYYCFIYSLSVPGYPGMKIFPDLWLGRSKIERQLKKNLGCI